MFKCFYVKHIELPCVWTNKAALLCLQEASFRVERLVLSCRTLFQGVQAGFLVQRLLPDEWCYSDGVQTCPAGAVLNLCCCPSLSNIVFFQLFRTKMTFLIIIKGNVYVKQDMRPMAFLSNSEGNRRKKQPVRWWWSVGGGFSWWNGCIFVRKVIYRVRMETSPGCIYWPPSGLSAVTLSWAILPYIIISNVTEPGGVSEKYFLFHPEFQRKRGPVPLMEAER